MINNNVLSTLQNTEATIFYLDSDYYPGQVPAQDVANVQELIASCIKHLNKLQQKVNADVINTNSARKMRYRKTIRTNASKLNSQLNYGLAYGESVDLSDAERLYGYIIHSDMSGVNVLVCAPTQAKLKRYLPEISDMLLGNGSTEDYVDWDEYAYNRGLIIRNDADADDAFYQNYDDNTNKWTDEIFIIANGDFYAVDIIGSDHFRF